MPAAGNAHPKDKLPTRLAASLARIDRSPARRDVWLETPFVGPIDVRHHVQGITRVDRGDKALVICSLSRQRRGSLIFAHFDVLRREAASGPRRLAACGSTLHVEAVSLPHPGEIQACDDLLAVASEGDASIPSQRWAELEMNGALTLYATARNARPAEPGGPALLRIAELCSTPAL